MKHLVKSILISILFISDCFTLNVEIVDVFEKAKIYSKQNYTDLLLSQKAIDSFFVATNENEKIVEHVNEYYKNRDFQYTWFNKDGILSAVTVFYNQLQNYSIDFNDNSFKNKQLDELINLVKNEENYINQKKNKIQNLELILTTTFFKYSKKVYSGITNNPHDLNWYIPRNKKNYQILLDSLVASKNQKKVWEPSNFYYKKLKEKLIEYREIEKKGGFPVISSLKKKWEITETDSCLLKVKQHLYITGDLKIKDSSIIFNDTLFKAITHYQNRMGLLVDGIIGPATLKELNIPIDYRIKQIMINMERLRWFPDEIEPDFLIINIPEFKLYVFENKTKIWDSKVVVGKEVTRTSIFKGSISKIVLNPYWNVPRSIIRNEMLPILKRNKYYLRNNNMQLISGNKIINSTAINWHNYKNNIPFSVRQKPGLDNALGKIKFYFPNDYSIYLHDTPSKKLFNEPKRAFSHGCIRVEKPKKLALHLLKGNENWNEFKVDTVLKTNKNTNISLKPNIPIYIVYFTAWVDNNDELNFRDDLYNLDSKLEKEIFAN